MELEGRKRKRLKAAASCCQVGVGCRGHNQGCDTTHCGIRASPCPQRAILRGSVDLHSRLERLAVGGIAAGNHALTGLITRLLSTAESSHSR